MLEYMTAGLKAKVGVSGMSEADRRWLNYNYPPGLRMFHYSTAELTPPVASLARKMHAAALIVCVIQPLALVNCFIQVAGDCDKVHGRFVLYALLNLLLCPALAMFSFYKGYYAICQGPGHAVALQIYRVSQIACWVCWAAFMLIHTGSFNGVSKLIVLGKCGGMGVPIALGLVEIALYGAAIGLGVLCFLRVKDVYGQEPYAKQQAHQQALQLDTEDNKA